MEYATTWVHWLQRLKQQDDLKTERSMLAGEPQLCSKEVSIEHCSCPCLTPWVPKQHQDETEQSLYSLGGSQLGVSTAI